MPASRSPRIRAAIWGWSRLRSWKRCPARVMVDQRRGGEVRGMVQTLLVEDQGKHADTSHLSVQSYTSSGPGARWRERSREALCLWEQIQRLRDQLYTHLGPDRIHLARVVLGQREHHTSHVDIVLDDGAEIGGTAYATWVALAVALQQYRFWARQQRGGLADAVCNSRRRDAE